MIPAFNEAIIKVGVTLGSLYFCFLNFNLLQSYSWFMLFHLCYYSITFRISSLTSLVETAIKEAGGSGKSKGTKALRTCANLFDQLCAAAIEINSTFSLSVLASLTVIMILSSFALCVYSSSSTQYRKLMFIIP